LIVEQCLDERDLMPSLILSSQNEWGGEDTELAVLMLHNSAGASSLMYNLYSEADRGIHIDSMKKCVLEQTTLETPSPSCFAMTDMLELKISPGPAALLFNPVFPANDPTAFVGFATTSLPWEEVLTSTVPDYVDGLTCVISTATQAYTYIIRKGGKPELIGEGDLHDPAYNKYKQVQVLNNITTYADTSATYTLTVYPTDKMFQEFQSDTPWRVAVSFVAVIFAVTCIFFLYDFLMRREASQRNQVLEMKRRFVRFISHEIRTPMNTVCMGLELLESEFKQKEENAIMGLELLESELNGKEENTITPKDNPEDLEFWISVIEDVKENSLVAVSILNDMLNYDKLETGTMKLEIGNVDIWDLVGRCVQQFQIQALKMQVEMKLEVVNPMKQTEKNDLEGGNESDHIDQLWVVGDDVRLSQVLRNVISVALRFTPVEGTVDVKVEYVVKGLPDARPIMGSDNLACTYPRAGSVRITINDTGVGLTEEQLSLLFAEGVQFDANKLQHGGGSGLGLNIAKGIAEQHQGTIKADSVGIGHGTSFIIELPLYEIPADELRKADDCTGNRTETTSVASEEPDAGPMRILVAEDSASSRKMLIRLLERSGCECVPAANGQDAVDAVKADLAAARDDPTYRPIDSILMDFEMPLLKGPEATRECRRLGYKGIIIGVTGNVLDEDIDYFIEHGADEVIPKPISLQSIKDSWLKNPGPSKNSGI
jgi:signal transduction histidine kinase